MLNTARRRAAPRATSSTVGYNRGGIIQVDPDADLISKIKTAWRIFFPERERPLSPKEEGKKRLRMILVADRYILLTSLFKSFLRCKPCLIPPSLSKEHDIPCPSPLL